MLRVSSTMKSAVFTTSFSGAPSTSRSWGSPSSVTRTVGSSAKRILGGSFLRPSAFLFSRSATFTFSSARSYEMTRFHVGTSASMIPANVFSFSGVMLGNRTRFTLMRRIWTDRSSRSTETLAEKKMTPNFGVFSSFFVTDTAARPVSVLPLKVSICGWYMTAVLPFGVVNSRGHGSGVSSAARTAPARSTVTRSARRRTGMARWGMGTSRFHYSVPPGGRRGGGPATEPQSQG